MKKKLKPENPEKTKIVHFRNLFVPSFFLLTPEKRGSRVGLVTIPENYPYVFNYDFVALGTFWSLLGPSWDLLGVFLEPSWAVWKMSQVSHETSVSG